MTSGPRSHEHMRNPQGLITGQEGASEQGHTDRDAGIHMETSTHTQTQKGPDSGRDSPSSAHRHRRLLPGMSRSPKPELSQPLTPLCLHYLLKANRSQEPYRQNIWSAFFLFDFYSFTLCYSSFIHSTTNKNIKQIMTFSSTTWLPSSRPGILTWGARS